MKSRWILSLLALALLLAFPAAPGLAQDAPDEEPGVSEAPADPWAEIAVGRGKLIGKLTAWNAQTKVIYIVDSAGKEWTLHHNEHSKSINGVPKAGTRLQALYAKDVDGKLWVIQLSLAGIRQPLH